MAEQVNAVNIIECLDAGSVTSTVHKISSFHNIIKHNLVQNHDYGIIPGTTKPTLFKPGAEKIMMLMRLTTEFDIIDSTKNFDQGFFQYHVKCKIFKNGILITEGLGACNTKESKYKNKDPYTMDNTVLKMAKKRALVDGTLLIASLSQIFTQDIEDMDIQKEVQGDAQPTEDRNNKAIELPKEEPKTKARGELITPAQAKRLFAISKGNAALCKDVCAKYGYGNSKEVRKDDYERICEEVQVQAA